MTIVVYVDGLCEPINPNGVACWGLCIYQDDAKRFGDKGVIGEGYGMSNNLAEYTALVKALKELLNLGWQNEEVIIRSDSKLLINQMTGWWNVHGGLYYPAYIEAVKLAQRFPKITFVWIPREENKEADSLSRQAYEEYCRQKGRETKYHEEMLRERIREKETCMTCRWVRFRGPHIGCWKNNAYHGWLPKRFAMNSKCNDFLKVKAVE